jgi:hypothetical protein
MYKSNRYHKKGLEVSYMVSYRVARTGKPHTIVEDVILPATADMAGTILGEKAQKHYTDNAFIKQHFHNASVTWQEMV